MRVSLPLPKPSVTVACAVVVAGAAFVLAAMADSLLVRLAAVVVGAAAAILLVRSAGSRSTAAGVAGVFLVPVVMLGIGTTVVGAVSDDSVSTPFGETQDRSADLDANMADALDRADGLIPGGSNHLQRITIDSSSTTVTLLDPTTGQERSSSDYGSGWTDSKPTSTSNRLVFGRSDVAALRLSDARDKVLAAIPTMGLSSTTDVEIGRITIEHRSDDDMLVASFEAGGHLDIEVDMQSELADTLDAGRFDKTVETAVRTMNALHMDPRARNLRTIDFMAVKEGSDSIGASSIMIDGGIELEFDAGDYNRVVVKPGRFPVAYKRDEPAVAGDYAFALAAVRQSVLTSIRDDMMKRFSLPAFDRDAVGYTVERSDSESPVDITMSVGPSSNDARATYTTTGRFQKKGS